MEEEKYFYVKNGEACGPATATVIRAMLRNGDLTLQTQVCPDWSEDWQPLYQFAELSIPASRVGDKTFRSTSKKTVRNLDDMALVSTEEVPGFERVESLGLVSANVVMAKNVVSDFAAGVKSVFGGEIEQYTKLMSDARDVVIRRIRERASALRADAVCGFRMTSSEIMQGMCEICAYGTAVKLTPSDKN